MASPTGRRGPIEGGARRATAHVYGLLDYQCQNPVNNSPTGGGLPKSERIASLSAEFSSADYGPSQATSFFSNRRLNRNHHGVAGSPYRAKPASHRSLNQCRFICRVAFFVLFQVIGRACSTRLGGSLSYHTEFSVTVPPNHSTFNKKSSCVLEKGIMLAHAFIHHLLV